MQWTYAAHPNPETSSLWRDDFWPPKDEYLLVESALGKLEWLWPWNDLEAAKSLVSKITEEQLMLFAVHHVMTSISGGGFDSGLDHLSGELAEEAIIGLRRFGLVQLANIMDEAWDAYGIRPIPRKSEDRHAHFAQMEFVDLPPRWPEMQNEFYRLLHEKTSETGYVSILYSPIAKYINTHRNRFFIT